MKKNAIVREKRQKLDDNAGQLMIGIGGPKGKEIFNYINSMADNIVITRQDLKTNSASYSNTVDLLRQKCLQKFSDQAQYIDKVINLYLMQATASYKLRIITAAKNRLDKNR